VRVALALGVIAAGLASRALPLPLWIGDVLYAVLIYVLVPRWPIALGICVLIEVSQTWEWLAPVRATRLGALVLGRGFLWEDLVAYAVGVACAHLVARISRSLRSRCRS
jgi:hypothetical protein